MLIPSFGIFFPPCFPISKVVELKSISFISTCMSQLRLSPLEHIIWFGMILLKKFMGWQFFFNFHKIWLIVFSKFTNCVSCWFPLLVFFFPLVFLDLSIFKKKSNKSPGILTRVLCVRIYYIEVPMFFPPQWKIILYI
jgi:hypothetical protein